MQFEKIMSHAEQKFANHKATLTYGGNCTTLLWKAPDTNSYFIKAVFTGYNVFIDGDLGSAVARLTETASLKALSNYWKFPNYFAEKIQCATDSYTYDYEDSRLELEQRYQEILENCKYNEEDRERLEDAKNMLLEEFSSDEGFAACKEGLTDWAYFDSNLYDWICSAGRTLHLRVYLWLLAFKMAYEQLEETEAQETTIREKGATDFDKLCHRVFDANFKNYRTRETGVKCGCGHELEAYYCEERLFLVECDQCETKAFVKANSPKEAAYKTFGHEVVPVDEMGEDLAVFFDHVPIDEPPVYVGSTIDCNFPDDVVCGMYLPCPSTNGKELEETK